MVQKEKLVQFYFNQYRDWSRAYKKKNNEGKKTYEQRIDRLLEDMQAPRGRLSQAHLEEFHRQLRNLAYFSFREENRFAIMKIRICCWRSWCAWIWKPCGRRTGN